MAPDKLRDLIIAEGATIARTLAVHPMAGEKFRGLSDDGREAWIAWTWLHHRLVMKGFSVAEALEIREEAMLRQHDVGTYAAIAEALA